MSFAEILNLSEPEHSNIWKFSESKISAALHHFILSHPSTSDSQTSSGKIHPFESNGHNDFFSGVNKGSDQAAFPLYIF